MDMLTSYLGGSIPTYLLVIIITSLAATAFVLGIKVQSTVHFIWPKDVASLFLYGLCLVDLIAVRSIFGIELFEAWFWLPTFTAYLLGFMYSSRGCYIMLSTPLLAAQRMPVAYIVPYWIDDDQYIQEQKNKALLKRVIFGIEHQIDCNTRLEPNWEFTIKHPYLPIPTIRSLLVDSIIDDEPQIVREDKWIKCIKFRTKINVAPASLKSKMDMMMIENAHINDVNENIKLSAELLKIKQLSYRESMAAAADLLCYATVDATPGIQLLNHITTEKNKKPKEEIKK